MKIIRNLSIPPLPCKSCNLDNHDVIVYVGFVFIIMIFME